MQNEKFRAKFSIKNDAKFKKLLRKVSSVVYRKNKFVFLMRAIELPFAALCAVALVVLFDIFENDLIVISDMTDVSFLARNLAIVLCVGIVLLYIYAAIIKPVLFTRTIYSKIDVEREQEIVIHDDGVSSLPARLIRTLGTHLSQQKSIASKNSELSISSAGSLTPAVVLKLKCFLASVQSIVKPLSQRLLQMRLHFLLRYNFLCSIFFG